VARGPCAVARVYAPLDRPCANLSHAAVTRYISAGFAVAWRVRALVRSGAILAPSAGHFSAWFGVVWPSAPPRDNDGSTLAPSAIIAPKNRLKI